MDHTNYQNQSFQDLKVPYLETRQRPFGVFNTSLEGELLYADSFVVKLFGYDSVEDLVISIENNIRFLYVNPEQRKAFVKRTLNSNEILHFETFFKRKNGTHFLAHTIYKSLKLIRENKIIIEGIIEDISDCSRSRCLYKNPQEKFRQIYQNSPQGDYCIKFDAIFKLSGTVDEIIDFYYDHAFIDDCNRTFAMKYGYLNEEALIGTKVACLHKNKDNPNNRKIIENFIKNNYLMQKVTTEELDNDGNICYFENYCEGLVENGYLIRVTGSQLDITQKLITELELINIKEKFQEKKDFSGCIARNLVHEIRTPMNAIISFSELTLNSEIDHSTRLVYHEIVEDNCLKLLDIIDSLIILSQIQSNTINLNISQVNVVELISEIEIKNRKIANSKDIGLYFLNNFNEVVPIIHTDKGKLFKVLDALVDNAIKFTERGYVKLIAIDHVTEVEFRIVDTGIGIDSKYSRSIFEPFKQIQDFLDPLHSGNGLGLTIAKTFTELLKGSINFSSNIGEGSEFSIVIKKLQNN